MKGIDFSFKMMNFGLKMMNCGLKMMNFVFNMMNFVFKTVRALKAPATWRALLLDANLPKVLFALASGTDRADGAGELCEMARQALISLAGLEGVGEDGIFGSAEERLRYFSSLLSRSLGWLREGRSSAPSAELRGAELLDGVQLLLALLSNLSSGRDELQAAWSAGDTAGVLTQLAEVTEELFSTKLLEEDSAMDALEDWLGDAAQVRLLLENDGVLCERILQDGFLHYKVRGNFY